MPLSPLLGEEEGGVQIDIMSSATTTYPVVRKDMSSITKELSSASTTTGMMDEGERHHRKARW